MSSYFKNVILGMITLEAKRKELEKSNSWSVNRRDGEI